MAVSKNEAYEKATMQELGGNPTGTRQDVIYRAMDLYAKECAIGFHKWADIQAVRDGENWWTIGSGTHTISIHHGSAIRKIPHLPSINKPPTMSEDTTDKPMKEWLDDLKSESFNAGIDAALLVSNQELIRPELGFEDCNHNRTIRGVIDKISQLKKKTT